MNFDLTENLIRIQEDGDGPSAAVAAISGATTEDSITYLPSGFTAIQNIMHGLAKQKKDWQIEIEPDDKYRHVKFEKSAIVKVPHQYWNEFSTKFKISNKGGMTSLGHLLHEAMEEDLENLRRELKPALVDYFNSDPFKTLEKQANQWTAWFGITSFLSKGFAVTIEQKHRDIQKLVLKLHKYYGNERGQLELLLEALRMGGQINTFEYLNSFDWIYGTKILSNYKKVKMIFEGTIDSTYITAQSIKFDDEKLAEEIVAELKPSVKIVKNVIFPVGGIFTSAFYRMLRNTIKEYQD